LARELADQGWSVWWDRRIPPGKTFDETIEEALDEAKAVVAVWTEAGVTSRWVRTEAAEGAARGVLVPVLMEDVRLPLAFRRIQVADLTNWQPGRDHAGFTELVNALNVLIGAKPVEEPPPLEPEDPVEQAILAAQARAADRDWEGVITLLSPLEADTPSFSTEYPEAAELLTRSHRKRDALELYEEAEVLYADGRWHDVVGRFDRILELDPDLQYGTDLKTKAERHIASERERRLAGDYERATRALNAREWPVAVARYEQLLAQSADYRDAAEQLERARAGAASEHHYRELFEQFREGRWDAVIAGMAELAAANPDFGDPDNLFERAEAQRDRAARQQFEDAERTTAGGGAATAAIIEPAVPPTGAPRASPPSGTPATAEAPSEESPKRRKGETDVPGPAVLPSADGTKTTLPQRVLAKWPLAIIGITALVVLIVVAVIASNDGGDSTPTTTASEAAGGGLTTAATSQGAAAQDTGGLICEVTDALGGSIEEYGFNAVAWEGAERAAADLGAEARVLESQPGADHEHDIVSFVDQGCDLIVTVGFSLADETRSAAEKNPDVSFAIVDFAYEAPPANLRGLVFAPDEAAFLAGYAAAGTTRTGKVATFGGMNIPGVTSFMDGFAGGVAHYNGEHGTSVEVLGWDRFAREGLFTGNFENLDDGHALAEDLVVEGADIVMPVAGPVGRGASAFASELGTFLVIGVDVDQTVANPEHAAVYLTSVMKRADVAVYEAAVDALEGRHSNEVYIGVLANEGVGIAPNNLSEIAPDELQVELEAVRGGIIDGGISVTD
jgi:basic membrane protein A